MLASKQLIPLLRAPLRRVDHELAFLPAALEITETPPSPVGRAIGATVIAVFCVALTWAWWGTVDIVATAPGRIVPSGRTKLVQPVATGVVRAIHVSDGQHVKAGEVLIELDPTMAEAEQQRLSSELIAAKLDVARLRAALADAADPLPHFSAPEGAPAAMVQTYRQFLIGQTAEQNSTLAEIDRQQAQREAERETTTANIGKLEATIPLLQERVNVLKTLYDKGLGTKLTYLNEAQQLIGQQQDLLVQQSRLRESDAAIASLKESRNKAAAEYRRSQLDNLAKAEQKVSDLSQDVVKAERQTKLQQLTAPIDGVVQQLAVHTVGGVVTPAQTLAVVVPLESHLEIEAMVSNRDIGFVRAGQPAEIKVNTFNFTRYGLLHGEVLSISQDAIPHNSGQTTDNRTSGPAPNAAESQGEALDYAARVSLDRTEMNVDDKPVKLGPGMAVTVEVKTGSRRIIDYLLSPVLRYKQEVLRER